ncbi:MAG TPA: winged helix-turn-helix domain-containing protein [Nitrososphaera sp.]
MRKTFKPNTEVLSRIAEAFGRNSSLKKTQLHLATRVRWDSFVNYLEWLTVNDYVRYSTVDGETYVLTDSGREMFEKLLKFVQEIKSD